VEKVIFCEAMERTCYLTQTWKRKRDKFSGLSRRVKRRKLASEGETKEDKRATDAAIRSAKKTARPSKINVPNKPKVPRQGKSKQGDKLGKAGFSHDQGWRGSQKEGIRAKRGDAVGNKIKGRKRR
jgi:ATP-dependent RNA helicase DDX27